jgi:hypothetical protein
MERLPVKVLVGEGGGRYGAEQMLEAISTDRNRNVIGARLATGIERQLLSNCFLRRKGRADCRRARCGRILVEGGQFKLET